MNGNQLIEAFLQQDVENGHLDLVFHFKDHERIFAHRSVMTELSPVMKTAMSYSWEEGRTGVMDVKFSFNEFKNFLHFCYTGECEVEMDNFYKIVEIANYYDVESFKVYCEKIGQCWIRDDSMNVIPLVRIARLFQLENLKKSCYIHINTSIRFMFGKNEKLDLEDEVALEILEQQKPISSPIQLFKFGVDWSCKKVMDENAAGTLGIDQLVAMFKLQFAKISMAIPLEHLDEKALDYACMYTPFFTKCNMDQCWNAILNESEN